MEFITEYGLFLAKTATILIAIVVIVSMISALTHKGGGKREHHGHIQVTKLNDWYKHMGDILRKAVLDSHLVKLQGKLDKQREKKEQAEKKKAFRKRSSGDHKTDRKRVFVLNFDGDMKASATSNLREEITTVLSVATPEDEVVVRLESSGGLVHSYGLAASQLSRIRSRKIPLTVCVDKVAASGGYMMACVADRILAAPFAVIGSIGVVGQLPNFHRLLQRIPVDYEMETAGEYKRTLTMFAENTDKDRQKFAEELEDTHQLFKSFIRDNRAKLDVDAVATGETWYGSEAVEKQLIDEVQTSDDYLTAQVDDADIFEVEYVFRKTLPERFGLASQQALDRLLLTWWGRLQTTRFFS
ncbi:protease SohB [Gilvimarinus sp. F26214L]|uniref:protease SohB n=1 Tax=Gilvimarinus sp. DZF01 TaxID=3461371 RepID=UPI004045DA63